MDARIFRLPFSLPEVYQGLAEAKGLLRADEHTLHLEFEIKDSLIGVLSTGVKEISLPLREVESVAFKKGWVRTRLFIRAYSMSAFGKLPQSKQGELELKIDRKDREDAERIESYLNLRISEIKLDLLDND